MSALSVRSSHRSRCVSLAPSPRLLQSAFVLFASSHLLCSPSCATIMGCIPGSAAHVCAPKTCTQTRHALTDDWTIIQIISVWSVEVSILLEPHSVLSQPSLLLPTRGAVESSWVNDKYNNHYKPSPIRGAFSYEATPQKKTTHHLKTLHVFRWLLFECLLTILAVVLPEPRCITPCGMPEPVLCVRAGVYLHHMYYVFVVWSKSAVSVTLLLPHSACWSEPSSDRVSGFMKIIVLF